MKHSILRMGWLCLAFCLPLVILRAQTPLLETEPNNTRATANPVQLGQTIGGQVSSLTDPDYFNLGVLPVGAYKLVIRYPQGMGPAGQKDWFNLLDPQDKEIPGFCYYPPDGSHVYLFLVCAPVNAVFKIHPNTDLGLTGKPYQFSVMADLEDPGECNNTLPTARQITQSGSYKGKIGTIEDFMDILYFKDLPAGDLKIKVSYPAPNSPQLLIALGKMTPQPLIIQAPKEAVSIEITEKIAQKADYYLTIQHFKDSMTMLTPYDVVFDFKPACTLTLNAAAAKVDSARCPLTDGRIELPAPTGGVAPFTYRLNNGAAQNSPVFANLAGGTYTLIAADSQNCADTVTIIVPCKPCTPPAVGINKIQDDAARKVEFRSVVTNGTVKEWNFGDGSKSTDANPTHTYQASGNYTVVLTVEGPCGTATATATVTVITGDFAIGHIKNAKPGTEVKVPVYSINFTGTAMTFSATLPDSSKWSFIRFENGTIPVQSQTYIINSPQGRFSFLFGSNGYPVKAGDTLFYLVFRLKPNLPPGDSIKLDLTGGATPFQVLTRVGNELLFADATLKPGRIDIIRNVKFQIKATGAKGNAAKGKATIISGSQSITLSTDIDGKIEGEILWSDTIRAFMRRDTITQDGINIVDVVLFNRAYVGLTTNGQTPYSILAADVDEDGKFTPKDISFLLNFMVGNVAFQPKQQFLFVNAAYTMPVWPSPDYFKPQKEIVLLNPDPSQTAVLNFIGIQVGDGDHSNPNLNRSRANWTYEQRINPDGTVSVLLYTDDASALGAQLELPFGADFAFERMETLQGNLQAALNAEKGRLRLAVLSNEAFDPTQPLMAFHFQSRRPGSARQVLLPAASGYAADAAGNAVALSLLPRSAQEGEALAVWPSPANQMLHVRGAQAGTLELIALTGKVHFRQVVSAGQDLEIPVGQFVAGTYLVKMSDSAGTTVHRISIVH